MMIMLVLFSLGGTPDGGAGGSMSMTIFLNRHTGFNRNCRVRFNIRVAEGIESGIRDEVSDQDGKSLGKGQLISEHMFFLTTIVLKDLGFSTVSKWRVVVGAKWMVPTAAQLGFEHWVLDGLP